MDDISEDYCTGINIKKEAVSQNMDDIGEDCSYDI